MWAAQIEMPDLNIKGKKNQLCMKFLRMEISNFSQFKQ